jgi:hypothetical protein
VELSYFTYFGKIFSLQKPSSTSKVTENEAAVRVLVDMHMHDVTCCYHSNSFQLLVDCSFFVIAAEQEEAHQIVCNFCSTSDAFVTCRRSEFVPLVIACARRCPPTSMVTQAYSASVVIQHAVVIPV